MQRNPAVRRRNYSCNFVESDDNSYGGALRLTYYEWKRGRERGFVLAIRTWSWGRVQGEASVAKDSLLSAVPRHYPRVFYESLAPGTTFIRMPPRTSKTSGKSMPNVCTPTGPPAPALPAYLQDQVILLSCCKKQPRLDQGQNTNNSWVTLTPVCGAVSRRRQLFLKSPVRWWCQFIRKIMISVFQSFNMWSGICF